MKIGVFQFAPEFGDKEKNLDSIESALSQIQVDLIVLPELCTTGYQFTSHEEASALCEPIPDGPSTKRLIEIAKKNRLHIMAGIGESTTHCNYNSAILLSPNGFIDSYRKIHLFAEEKLWFKPGDTDFKIWDIGLAKIGVMICYDWIYPESARSLALLGADIICHPANLVLPYCPDAMITRSIENRVFTITCNRVGHESRQSSRSLTYIGLSQVTSPKGEVLFRMGREDEGIRIVDINPGEARNKQITSHNHLWEDRRKEFYL